MGTYVVTHANGQTYTTLGEGTLDNSLGISLIGQNFHNYGQLLANNFLRLLENQANSIQPTNPVAGQIWWNTSTKVLSFFDGDKFKPCSSSAVGVNPPINPLYGDQWWDENVDQLKIWNQTEWHVIGPVYPKGQSFTGMIPDVVTDTSSHSHIISMMKVNGETVATVSNDPTFTLSYPFNGITVVSKGITLAQDAILSGTSVNSGQSGNVDTSDFVRKSAVSSTMLGSLILQGLDGLTVSSHGSLILTADTLGNQWVRSYDSNVIIAAGTTAITVSNTAITSSVSPTVASSVTTKSYVDTLIHNTDNLTRSYVDASIGSVVNSSPIPTLAALSAAIANDTAYHTTISNALNLKANLHSPALTGVPTAITAVPGTNTTQVATTAFVIANQGLLLVVASPTQLGGVKQGNNVSIAPDGTLSVAAPTTTLAWGAITNRPNTLAGYGITDAAAAAPVQSVFGRTGNVVLQSGDVTSALTYTPYNATNPNHYITAADVPTIAVPVQSVFGRTGNVALESSDVVTALGYTPYDAVTNANVFITSAEAPVQKVFNRTGNVAMQSSDVTDALGFTPYSDTNPASYITSAALPQTLNSNVEAWSPGTITTGTTISSNVTVTGATLGDFVVWSYDADLNGAITLPGMVVANNVVTVSLINFTGADATPTDGNVRVRILKV